MTRASRILSVRLSHVLSVVAVLAIGLVGCAGRKTAIFDKVKGGQTGKAIDQCRQTLREQKVGRSDGSSTKKAPGKPGEKSSDQPSGKFNAQGTYCIFDQARYDALSDEQKLLEQESPFPLGEAYVAKKPFDLKYEIATADNRATKGKEEKLQKRATLILKVLMQFDRDMSKEVVDGVEKYIANSCINKIEKLWGRSRGGVSLDLRVARDSNEEFDRVLDLRVIEPGPLPDPKNSEKNVEKDADSSSAKVPHLVMAEFPFHSDLFPLPLPQCRESCKDKKGEEKLECASKCQMQVNEPFCQSFAKLTAHWLGVVDPAAGMNCSLAEDGKHPAEGTPSVTLGYRKPPAEERDAIWAEVAADSYLMAATPATEKKEIVNARNFWDTVRIDSKDLVQVLAPVCPVAVK